MHIGLNGFCFLFRFFCLVFFPIGYSRIFYSIVLFVINNVLLLLSTSHIFEGSCSLFFFLYFSIFVATAVRLIGLFTDDLWRRVW